jgi:ribosomal protein S18 acetylase RimI-like enzyme
MIVRPATAADLPRLVALLKQEIGYQRQIAFFYDVAPNFDWNRFAAAKLNDPNERVFVAEQDGAVCGYIDVRALGQGPLRKLVTRLLRPYRPPSFVRSRSIGRIEDCYVESGFRRRGIGSALVAEGLGWLRSKGVTAIELGVATANAGGKAFWEKQGFSPYRLLMSKTIQ